MTAPAYCRDCGTVLVDPGSKRCRPCYRKAPRRVEIGTRRTGLVCSFCGKMQSEVAALIAGPTVYICDECVGLCALILVDREKVAGCLDAWRGLDLCAPRPA